MAQARSDHSDRDKAARIARLKERLAKVYTNPMDMVPILKGILDLLADEL